jgi:RNA polymerase sigma factor (sigma-70 family)
MRQARQFLSEGGAMRVGQFSMQKRAMLVRYCARFTRDWSVAEDLAQQTLLEAWQKADRLPDLNVRDSWLVGVAHKVCLRWLRQHAREASRTAAGDARPTDPDSSLADSFDLVAELERDELARLLERALGMLPRVTRLAVVARYIEQLPQAEVAARLGLTEGAVEARLHRGKLALRRVLARELRPEAAAYGLVDAATDGWQETRIWCPECGHRRLLARLPMPPGVVSFRCPTCCVESGVNGWDLPLSVPEFVSILGGRIRPWSVLDRIAAWAYGYYRRALEGKPVPCAQCGRLADLRLVLPDEVAALGTDARMASAPYGLLGRCAACGWPSFASPLGLVLSLPEVRRFWHEQSRMRLISGQSTLEVEGQLAFVTRFESLAQHARLDVISACGSLRVLGMHASPVPSASSAQLGEPTC